MTNSKLESKLRVFFFIIEHKESYKDGVIDMDSYDNRDFLSLQSSCLVGTPSVQ